MTTLLLCVLTLLVSDAGRPAPGYAAIALKPGDIVIGGYQQASVLDASTGQVQPIPTNPRFDYMGQLATGPTGEVYVADNYFIIDDFTDAPTLARLDPTTGVPTVITYGGLGFMTGFASDRAGNLYVADDSARRIVRVNATTGTRTTLSSSGKIYSPAGLAVEGDGSVLTTVSVSSSGSGPRQLLRIRSGTNAQEVVSAGALFVQP